MISANIDMSASVNCNDYSLVQYSCCESCSPPPPASGNEEDNTVTIIAIVAAAAVCIVVAIIVAVVVLKKKQAPPSTGTAVAQGISMPDVGVSVSSTVPNRLGPRGAKFDPNTGQPIPKFDPETGKQNW